MSATSRTREQPAARRTRTMLISFLGAVVRPLGGWTPISGTVALLRTLELDEAAIRTAVSRYKRRGWLVAETRGTSRGYRLTAGAGTVLAEGDRIIWHPPPPAQLSDGWCVLNFSIPEQSRAKRHQLRSRLGALGFGSIGSAVWVAPARQRRAAEQVLADLDLQGHSAVFVGDYVSGIELDTLVRATWDLEAIDRRYRHFVAAHGPVLDRPAADGPRAFADYLAAVDAWRPLPYEDPGLPADLVGPDWSGTRAAALFERLVAVLQPPALQFAASVLDPGAGARPPAPEVVSAMRMSAARPG